MTDFTKKPCTEYKAHGSSKLPCETCGFLWAAHDRRVRSFTQRRAETNRVNIRRDIDTVAAVLNSWPDTVSKQLARAALDRIANRLVRVTNPSAPGTCDAVVQEIAEAFLGTGREPSAMLADNETHDLGEPVWCHCAVPLLCVSGQSDRCIRCEEMVKPARPKDPPLRDHWCQCIEPKPTREFERRMTVCECCLKEVLP